MDKEKRNNILILIAFLIIGILVGLFFGWFTGYTYTIVG